MDIGHRPMDRQILAIKDSRRNVFPLFYHNTILIINALSSSKRRSISTCSLSFITLLTATPHRSSSSTCFLFHFGQKYQLCVSSNASCPFHQKSLPPNPTHCLCLSCPILCPHNSPAACFVLPAAAALLSCLQSAATGGAWIR